MLANSNSEKIMSEKFIKNLHVKSCRNCIFYEPNNYNTDFTSGLSKCKKFGEKDIITGKITYDYADWCRKYDSKCGIEGKYFELDPDVDTKILKHTIVSNLPISISISLMVFTFLYYSHVLSINK